ncbi:MAG TPA: hypothetical protein VGK31_05570 [Thermoanaerobaculia bacterium]
MRDVRIDPTFERWQPAARGLLREGIPPGEVQPEKFSMARSRRSVAAARG